MRLDVDAQPQPQSLRGRPQQCSHPYISMVLLILGIFCFLFVVRCLWRTIVGVFLDLLVFSFVFVAPLWAAFYLYDLIIEDL